MPAPRGRGGRAKLGHISKVPRDRLTPICSCLICCEPLQKKGSSSTTNAEKSRSLFLKICSIFKVDLSISTWDFGIEAFPFCGDCTKGIQQLGRLQEKLEAIQRDIETGIRGVKNKLRESDHKFISTDLRVIEFRSKVSGHSRADPCPESQSLFESNHPSGSISSVAGIHSLSGTNPITYYSSGFQLQPLHGLQLQNTLADFSGLSSNPNSTSHQNIHFRPDDFGNVGLVEVQVEFDDRSNCDPIGKNDGTEDDSSHEILDDPKDEDYDPSAIDDSNYSKTAFTDRSNKRALTDRRRISKRPIIKPKKSIKKVNNINTGSPSYNKVEQGTQSKDLEYFSPLKTTNDGKMYYENIEIAKNEVGYVCGICGYNKVRGHSSVSLRKMKIHIKGVHFDAYKCDICKKSFTSNDILNQHTKRIHILGKIPCDICQKLIRARGWSMIAHLWTHKNEEERAEARALGLEPKKSIKIREIDGKHKCSDCGKSFIKPNRLKVHMKTHLAPELRRDLKCPDCDKMFSSQVALRNHITSRHQLRRSVWRFHCATCNKNFFKKNSRDEHFLRMHTPHEKKEFTCTICNKRHALLSHLKLHLKNHRPAEDFKTDCDICGVRMLNSDTLKEHQKKYHDRPRPKPVTITVDINAIKSKKLQTDLEEEVLSKAKYKVDGTLRKSGKRLKRFETADDGKLYYEGYEVSKLNGGGFSCVTCGLEFRTKINRRWYQPGEKALKIHINGVHLGEYACLYCGKKFKSNKYLISHKHKVHYLVKWKCETCGMELDRKKYSSHLWSHKNPEEMVIALNSGERIPSLFKNLKNSLARKVEENVTFRCGDCSESFSTPLGLDGHRIENHPRTIIRNSLTNLSESSRRKSNRFRKRKRQNLYNEQSSSDSDTDTNDTLNSESDIDQGVKISVIKLCSLQTRTKPEENPRTAKLKLNSLPQSLVSAKNIRMISDELISYVSSTGKMKLISLDPVHDAEDSSNASSSDGEILEVQHESDGLSEMEFKIFPDPDSIENESTFHFQDTQ